MVEQLRGQHLAREPLLTHQRHRPAGGDLRVASSPRPAAIASRKSAGSLRGARPEALISTTRRTTRRPSSAMHSAAPRAFSTVSVRSPT
jgi:hypothetical protein